MRFSADAPDRYRTVSSTPQGPDREDFYHHGGKSCIMEYMLARFSACLSSSLTLLVLMGAGGVLPSQAQSTSLPSETVASERSLMAERFLSGRLGGWQQRLKL